MIARPAPAYAGCTGPGRAWRRGASARVGVLTQGSRAASDQRGPSAKSAAISPGRLRFRRATTGAPPCEDTVIRNVLVHDVVTLLDQVFDDPVAGLAGATAEITRWVGMPATMTTRPAFRSSESTGAPGGWRVGPAALTSCWSWA